MKSRGRMRLFESIFINHFHAFLPKFDVLLINIADADDLGRKREPESLVINISMGKKAF